MENKSKIFLEVEEEYDSDLIVGGSGPWLRQVYLKEYDRKEFLKEDLEIIESHGTTKTIDGLEYYTFTRGLPFEEIKRRKEDLMGKIEKEMPVAEIKEDDSIFGSIEYTVHFPKTVVKEHDMKDEIRWDCCDDHWDTNNRSEIQEHLFYLNMYGKKEE
jgi:hypothetical protein